MTVCGKNMNPCGEPPAIALINPKFPINVGNVIRLSSCYGFKQVWFTGNRVSIDPNLTKRLPREERMKGYKDVQIYHNDYFLDQFKNSTPVCIEITGSSECLYDFKHPENPVYIFGPEDGGVPSVTRRHCHSFVSIPTKHCLNLNNAVHAVMQDRAYKEYVETGVKCGLAEHRGWADSNDSLMVTKK